MNRALLALPLAALALSATPGKETDFLQSLSGWQGTGEVGLRPDTSTVSVRCSLNSRTVGNVLNLDGTCRAKVSCRATSASIYAPKVRTIRDRMSDRRGEQPASPAEGRATHSIFRSSGQTEDRVHALLRCSSPAHDLAKCVLSPPSDIHALEHELSPRALISAVSSNSLAERG